MATSVLLYLLAALRIKLIYLPCGVLVLLSILTFTISPLTLAVMSLERYVAVCYPLRHATVFNMRSTGIAIAVVWSFSLIYILIRGFMLLYVLTDFSLMQMGVFCSKEAIFYAPIFNDFEEVYAITLFLSIGVVIIGSYIGVSLVARSVSTNKASARKALQTLMLHMIQLILILTSTFITTVIITLARIVGRLALMRVYNVCFVCFNILPKCLSALIYGLRDQTIRAVLMQNLCCQCRCSVIFRKSQ
ncbi:odorant receptor 131-2-like [Scomber japonicus]|uniref:odorant receptor 131-2-like n=1 Tax=Scomber japonicus TaxID=13676 RepID=UPI0023058E5A|nr:odorant receptor 131-2-like [Scomber japonicus]